MKYAITYMRPAGLLVIKAEGRMHAAGFLAMAKDILECPHCVPGGNALFDHRDLDFSDVSTEDLERIRAFHVDNEQRIGDGKSAIVVKPGLSRAWHALWSKGEKIKTGNRVQVFEDYNDAVNWAAKVV